MGIQGRYWYKEELKKRDKINRSYRDKLKSSFANSNTPYIALIAFSSAILGFLIAVFTAYTAPELFVEILRSIDEVFGKL